MGLISGDSASAIGKPAKLEAKAGDVRIKRTIKFMNTNDVLETRVIYYTDKDKVSLSIE